MSGRNRIFLRIVILVFLLISSIGITESFFEIKHRQDDTLRSIEGRVAILASVMDSLISENALAHMDAILSRLDNFHPSVDAAFIELDQGVFLSSAGKKIPSLFLGQWDKHETEIKVREFKDDNGTVFLDVAAQTKKDSLYILHVVLVKSLMKTGYLFPLKLIAVFSLLTFLISIPLTLGIANRTTRENTRLMDQLNEHGRKLEKKVQDRTMVMRRFKHIVSVTTDHMSFIDRNYIYRAVNNSYLQAFNKTHEEIIDHSISEIHGEEVFESEIRENFDRCLAGEKINYQAWFDFPGLGRLFMDVTYFPFKDEDSTFSGVVVGARDITHASRAENLLRQSEERFRSLFDGISIGVAIYTAVDDGKDFVFLDYNTAGQEMDGVSKTDAIDRRVTEVFPGVKEFGMLEIMRRVWKTGIPEEHPVSIYTDQKISYWRHNSLFKLPSGEVIAVYTNETARMQAKVDLQEQHNRFVTVLDSLDAVVYVADMDTHELLFANKHVRDQFGDIIGKTCWQAIQSDQTGPCSFCTNDCLLDENGHPREPLIWEFQNTVDQQWYQCRDQAIPWPDGRLVRLEIATNITNRINVEKSNRQQGVFLKSLADATQILLASAGSVPYQEFLDLVGPASNAGLAYIVLNHQASPDNLLLSNKAIWYADPSGNTTEDSPLKVISYQEHFPNWYETLKKGEVVISSISKSPSPERKLFEDKNLTMVLIIPIMVDSEFVGFIGFGNCLNSTAWSLMEQAYLEAATFDMAQAIKRSRSEKLVRDSLKEKEVLLREIHHRVKNNMQVVTSLLNLQARKISNEKALDAIRESQDRIHVMSLVHEALYLSDDLHSITMQDYFQRLSNDIAKLHTEKSNGIECRVLAENVHLSINDAIPIGLIANELLTNAFKHAFKGKSKGLIEIILQEIDNNGVELVVSDNGVGISESIDLQDSNTLGLQLVSRLANGQLGGAFEVVRENGSAFHIRFNLPNN